MKITAEIAAMLGTWIGSESSYMVAAEALSRAMASGGNREFKIDQMGDQDFGQLNDMVQTEGPLAIINISGSLIPKAEHWLRNYGVVGYNNIREAMVAVLQNDQIKHILLNMDSPGGAVTGISELSDFMLAARKVKPIDTYTGTMMASGGYWLGSIGTKITADKLAVVGSIGVITTHVDVSQMYADMGIKVTVLRAGEFKALGTPFEALDEKSKAKIEADLQTYYRAFTSTVAAHRNISEKVVLANMADGREFIGKAALDAGLVDQIGGFDSVVNTLLSLHNPQRQPGMPSKTGADMSKQKKRVLTDQGAAAVASGLAPEVALADPKLSVEIEAEEQAGGGEAAGDESSQGAGDGAQAGTEGEGQVAPAPAADPAAGADAAAAVNAAVAPLQAQISGLTDQLVDAKMAAKESDQKFQRAQTSLTGFRQIAAASVQRLQVALGMPATDCAALSDEILLESYNSLQATFSKRFPAGQQSQAPQEDDGKVEAHALPAGAIRAVIPGNKKR
jgi:signal peptide peptidase SppA